MPPPSRPERSRGVGRAAGLGALALVIAAIAYVVFGGSGGADYHLIFENAGQLVRGDQVQVGGVPVGSVTSIQLTHGYKARVTIHVDSSITPLHQGTVAQVRVPSLLTVANRYILLSLGPNNSPALANGATLPLSAEREPVVDLDELLNSLNARTRRGLSEFIQGTGEQYAGAGRALGRSIEYFAPFLSETNHFFSELVRDQRVFTSFLVETAKAVTTIGARSEPLTDLIENSNTTFSAIGSRQRQLAAGLRTLPRALRQGNRTFAELPSALTALKALVETSRPTTPSLNALFSHLRPLLSTATPVVRNFHLSFNRPGANNDLTDLAAALPALARTLTTASPATVTSLRESVPVTAFWGPYSPDLIGTFRTFGQAGSYYEGNGHYARVSPVFPLFHLEGNTLKPAAGTAQAFEALKSAQLRRCPGGATTPAPDGSSPFTDGELLSCDPLQVP